MRNIHVAILAAMLVLVLVLVIGVSIPDEEPVPPPTCIEVRGPATDPAEHAWSMKCLEVTLEEMSIGLEAPTQMACIESACIAFRGMP